MRLLPSLVLLTLLGGPLAAQQVRGRVVDEAGAPIGHALVQLRSESGAVEAQVVTSGSGHFVIPAPASGRHRVRLAAIGFQPRLTDAFEPGDAGHQLGDLAMVRAVVTLAEIRVEASASACGSLEAGGAVLARLLDASQSAMEVMAAIMADRRQGFRIRQLVEHSVPARPVPIVTVDTAELRSVAWPILSLSPDSAARFGFIVPGVGGTTWYGPDARVLFSPWFLGSHCFAIEAAAAPGDPIGVRFEPLALRGEITDIAGTLELDPTSLALRRLTFRHVNLPLGLPDGVSGGEVRFAALPSGTWMPVAWRLYAPWAAPGDRTTMGRMEMRGEVIADP